MMGRDKLLQMQALLTILALCKISPIRIQHTSFYMEANAGFLFVTLLERPPAIGKYLE